MAIATTPTLLSLDRFAQIAGIPPIAFNGAYSETVFPGMTGGCNQVWYQYSWQNADQVSREDLAREIAIAERDIKNELGYWPAPTWIVEEVHRYPTPYRRAGYRRSPMRNVRNQFLSIPLKSGKFIQGGQRACTLMDTAVPVYSDEDGDGFDETATVTLAITDEDAVLCQLKVYFEGHDGDPEWEIRPARTATYAGGTFTATFWTWQLIEPDTWNALPSAVAGPSAINVDTNTYLVNTVEVRREYNDYSASHGTLFWEGEPTSTGYCTICGGEGCAACAFTTQSLCMHVRDTDLGFAAVVPACYNPDEEGWIEEARAVDRDPDQVTLNYFAGEMSDRHLANYTCDPLDEYLARAIAFMAIARLERDYCNCGAITALAERLRRDTAVISSRDGESRFINEDELNNPFGTMYGEVRAWRIVNKMLNSTVTGGSV